MASAVNESCTASSPGTHCNRLPASKKAATPSTLPPVSPQSPGSLCPSRYPAVRQRLQMSPAWVKTALRAANSGLISYPMKNSAMAMPSGYPARIPAIRGPERSATSDSSTTMPTDSAILTS